MGAEIVQQAVEIFSFEKLAKRQPGEEDKTSFFRKGIVKDWEIIFLKVICHFSGPKLVMSWSCWATKYPTSTMRTNVKARTLTLPVTQTFLGLEA